MGVRVDHASQVEEKEPGGTRARVPAARLSSALWRRPWARATLLLTPPLAWFLLIYLAALVVLLITAFWQINPFTTNIERVWTLTNFQTIFSSPAYLEIIGRTVAMAAAVTVVDAIVAFPFAYYMARIASPRTRTALFVAILLPLWASYLAKVYSWLLIFTKGGVLDSVLNVHLIYTNIGIANNVPFAAAMAMIPIAIMAVYLIAARALGAFREI